jgi:hypothetical protein
MEAPGEEIGRVHDATHSCHLVRFPGHGFQARTKPTTRADGTLLLKVAVTGFNTMTSGMDSCSFGERNEASQFVAAGIGCVAVEVCFGLLQSVVPMVTNVF